MRNATKPTFITMDELEGLMTEQINNLPENIKMIMWDDYAEQTGDNTVQTFDLNEIGGYFGSDYEGFARMILRSDIDINAEYYSFDGNGHIKTYDNLSDENSPFSAKELASEMIRSLQINSSYADEDTYDEKYKEYTIFVHDKKNNEKIYLCTVSDNDMKTLFNDAFGDNDICKQLIEVDFFGKLQTDVDNLIYSKQQKQTSSFKP